MGVNELLRDLRGEMDRKRDSLDGGLLAPGWVLAMSWDDQVEAMEELAADSALLHAHQPLEADDGSTCVADGLEYPCYLIRDLAERYSTDEGPEAGRAKDLDDVIERLGRGTA